MDCQTKWLRFFLNDCSVEINTLFFTHSLAVTDNKVYLGTKNEALLQLDLDKGSFTPIFKHQNGHEVQSLFWDTLSHSLWVIQSYIRSDGGYLTLRNGT